MTLALIGFVLVAAVGAVVVVRTAPIVWESLWLCQHPPLPVWHQVRIRTLFLLFRRLELVILTYVHAV